MPSNTTTRSGGEPPPVRQDEPLSAALADIWGAAYEGPMRVASSAIGDIEIIPLNSSPHGIAVDTAFSVKTSAPMTLRQMLDSLSVSDGVEFTLSKAVGDSSSPTANQQGDQQGDESSSQPDSQADSQAGSQADSQANSQPGDEPNNSSSNQQGGEPGDQPDDQLGDQPGGQPNGQPDNQAGNQAEAPIDDTPGNSFILSLAELLENDKLYNIEYAPPETHPLSFAFQTEALFGVTGTTPGRDSYSVPANSGIEVSFNRELAGSFDSHFRITPHVSGRFDRVGNTHIFIPNELGYGTQYEVVIKRGLESTDGEVLDKDYVFSFYTAWGESDKINFSVYGEMCETFLPDDDVFVEVSISSEIVGNSFEVEVYDLRTPERYTAYSEGGEGGVTVSLGGTSASVGGTAATTGGTAAIGVGNAVTSTGSATTGGTAATGVGNTAITGMGSATTSVTAATRVGNAVTTTGAAATATPVGASLEDIILRRDDLLESLSTELFINSGEYSIRHYIMLHKPLPQGYYLISVKTSHLGQEYSLVKLIQVSSLSVFSASLSGEVCFWVNDAATGNPAEGAVIELDGKTARTDSEGKAIIKDTEMSDKSATRISYGNYPVFVYHSRTFDPYEMTASQKFYSYLYTDRNTYKPNDSIDVYGVVKGRGPEYALSLADSVTVKLGDMVEAPVELDEYGSFNISLPVRNMSGYANLELCLNGESLTSSYINFADYDRDSYVINTQLNRLAYFPEERAEVSIFLTTFDGLPIEGVSLNSQETYMTTDANGFASSTLDLYRRTWHSSPGWLPFSGSFWFALSGSENYMQNTYAHYLVVPGDVMVETEHTGSNTVKISSHAIDRDAIENHLRESEYNLYYVDPDVFRGGTVDVDYRIDITMHTTTRIKTGETYDFIEKKSIDTYRYEYGSTPYDTLYGRTVNGEALTGNLPVSNDPLIRFSGQIWYYDRAGRELSIDFTWSGSGSDYFYHWSSSVKDFYFRLVRNSNASNANSSGGSGGSGGSGASPYNAPYALANTLRIGETGSIQLMQSRSDSDEPIADGRIITIVTNGRIINATAGSPDGTPIAFTEECVNLSYVFGAYFDGKYIYPISYPLGIYFDNEEKKLNYNISFDKETYQPGDEVTATIKVTDHTDWPKQAMVNLSVVDEAVLSGRVGEPNFLNILYNSANIFSYLFYSYGYYGSNYFYHLYTSYTPRESFGPSAGGAEAGDENQEANVRREFIDNPAFMSIETDSQGIAVAKFKLSDDITSWRVTVHGITKDGYAGDAKENIVSTLPYYVNTVMTDNFVEGDDVAALVKSFGREYKLNESDVEYSVDIFNDSGTLFTETKTNKNYASFNAGRLPIGGYTIRVKGSIGSGENARTDIIEKPFTVKADSIPLPLKTTQLISPDNPALSPVNVLSSPVRVTMHNGDIKPIMDILWSCVNYNSNRTDATAATAYADYFLYSLRESGSDAAYISEGASVLPGSGAIPELTYGDADLFYTARFAAAFPELVNKTGISLYIRSEVQFGEVGEVGNAGNAGGAGDTDNAGDADDAGNAGGVGDADEVGNASEVGEAGDASEVGENPAETPYDKALRAAGYFALAAIGESVLLDIYKQIEIIESIPDQARFRNQYYEYLRVLYYAAALCAVGDDSRAHELISKYPVYEDLNGGFLGASIADAKMTDEMIKTLTLYINTTVDPEKAYEYLTAKEDNTYVSDICEKINFLKKAVPIGGVESEVQYSLNGEIRTETLKNFNRVCLIISQEQFEGLNLRALSGSTEVSVAYMGHGDALDPAQKKIGISRRVADIGNNEVRITYDIQFPAGEEWHGSYLIKDRVPSNMRYTSSPSDWKGGFYVSNPEKQSVEISVFNYPSYSDSDNSWDDWDSGSGSVDSNSSGGGTGSGGIVRRSVSYNAVKVNDATAVNSTAYIGKIYDSANAIWGKTD